jgi:hypothetical protein
MSTAIDIELPDEIEIEDADEFPLASDEKAALERCEAVIARGVQTFIQVGDALAEIRNGKLYRMQFATFEDYCREKWGIGGSRARQLIGAANVAHEIESVTTVTLSNEAQARAVAKAAPADRPEVLVRAVEIAGDDPLTAKHITQAAAEISAPTPDLADILLRLDAHGYAKIGTHQKGITTFYSFRDFRSDAEESAGELELAEGELPYWLTELDDNARRAEERNAQYLDAKARFEVLRYDLRRDGKGQFSLYKPEGGLYATAPLPAHLKTLATFEAGAAKRAAAAAPALPSEDEQHRATVEYILTQPLTSASIQQAYDHAREIHDVDLYNKMIALIDRATDEPEESPPSPRPASATVAAYNEQVERDDGRIQRAQNLIATGEYDAARTLLSYIEVSTHARDQLLAQITAPESAIRAAARAFAAQQRERLKKFSQSGMISQTTFSQALDHIEALIAETA